MDIVVIAHNIRSVHNVGSILRTADGFGIRKVYLTGYTPYPTQPNDTRLPHIRAKLTEQIHKTALGAETSVPTEYRETPEGLIAELKAVGHKIVALEQNAKSINLDDYKPGEHVALLLGEEVHGITSELLGLCDDIIEIPMRGRKESFNVSVAAGISMYVLSKPHI